MSQIVLLNPQILINSVDLSNRVDQTTIEETFADIDTTTFGQNAKTRTAGLGDHKFTVEFQQDFAATEVAATIDPLIGTVVPIVVKPVNSATSATNPAYEFNCLITQWKPIDGKVGDLSKASVTWPISGSVAKATS